MTLAHLVLRNLSFYRRTHVGVAAGVAVATAVLVGALVVGDCVRYSLRSIALARLGGVELAMPTGDRMFRSSLADELSANLGCPVVPVLQLSGIAISPDGQSRANRVQVLGVDHRFWSLGTASAGSITAAVDSDGVVLNDHLAERLGVRVGDSVLLRIGKPSLLPLDAPLSSAEETTAALRLTVRHIASPTEFGRFSLRADQFLPRSAFVSLRTLQEKTEFADRANLLLVGRSASTPVNIQQAQRALQATWQPADADLELRDLPQPGAAIELRTGRVFIDPTIATALQNAIPDDTQILVYFVNELRISNRATPYSLVAAIEPSPGTAQTQPDALSAGLAGLGDDEMLINTWLQEDLAAKVGDVIAVRFFVMSEGRTLTEQTHDFRVRGVIPIAGAAADRELMPKYPGFSQAENCRDWKPGIPIDLDRIRDKDEHYWDQYRGTPKAFVNLKTAQRIWGNRFGNLTAIRYPANSPAAAAEIRQRVETAFKHGLDPASVGLSFQPVREQALAAGGQGLDFGQLFVGLSFFLIVAALLLTGLLFALSVEQRAEEIGTLLALGFRPAGVRRLLLLEGGVLVLLGGCVGVVVGTVYTRAILYGLATIWRSAAGITSLQYHAEPATLAIGLSASVLVALATLWLSVRRYARQPATWLLAGSGAPLQGAASLPQRTIGWAVSIAAVAGAVVILLANGARRDASAAGAFFAIGGLLLIGGLGFTHALLSATGYSGRPERLSLMGLGLRSTTRRRSRSLATVAMLACGTFLVVAIGANRHGPESSAHRRSSGTGGFALFGESTLPIPYDLNTAAGRDAYGLSAQELAGVAVVALRVRDGDDASCLNPQRAQVPRLLGVKPEALQSRAAFTFVKAVDDLTGADAWQLLKHDPAAPSDMVPAIGDEATVTWGLHKKVGDTIPFLDEHGWTFSIRIVGIIANSVLQGSLLIAEDSFITRFPSESGYRMFLIDAPADRAPAVSQALGRALQDRGLDLTPTQQRLAAFNVVENTYLSIFQLLGGLGLLLGCGGLGMVVMRNVLERRSELAIMRAVGFSRRALRWFVLSEHWLLLLLGLACGTIAGLAAVLPALRSPGAEVPAGSIALTLLAVAASGAIWAWIATVLALRGRLLSALWNE